MTEIRLISLGAHPRDIALDDLRRGIEAILPVRVEMQRRPLDIDFALDPSRKQYHSTALLQKLLEQNGEGDSKLLGVTPYDLFVPVLTFVFGQAQLLNRAAVFSTFRLHNEFYGLPLARDLLAERSLKEALHELGHTFGLRHCTGMPCVMSSSTYVEEIDIKPADFCLHCRALMQSV